MLLFNKDENVVAKGEIARFEQLPLLKQCFQKSFAGNASNCVYNWKKFKPFPGTYTRNMQQKRLIPSS